MCTYTNWKVSCCVLTGFCPSKIFRRAIHESSWLFITNCCGYPISQNFWVTKYENVFDFFPVTKNLFISPSWIIFGYHYIFFRFLVLGIKIEQRLCVELISRKVFKNEDLVLKSWKSSCAYIDLKLDSGVDSDHLDLEIKTVLDTI